MRTPTVAASSATILPTSGRVECVSPGTGAVGPTTASVKVTESMSEERPDCKCGHPYHAEACKGEVTIPTVSGYEYKRPCECAEYEANE